MNEVINSQVEDLPGDSDELSEATLRSLTRMVYEVRVGAETLPEDVKAILKVRNNLPGRVIIPAYDAIIPRND